MRQAYIILKVKESYVVLTKVITNVILWEARTSTLFSYQF